MNQNEQTISKLLVVALALALLISTISLIATALLLRQSSKAERSEGTERAETTPVQLRQLGQPREMERHTIEQILDARLTKRRTNAGPRLTNPIPDTITLKADRAASLTSTSSPLRGPELDVGVRIWVTGRVEYNTAVHFTLPSELGKRRIKKAVLKLAYLGSWGTNDKRAVTAHRLTENWSEFLTPFTIGREPAFATNTAGGPIAGWILWDATAAVQYWATHPGEDFGLLLVSDPTSLPDNSLRFASTRFEDTTLHPVLEITSSDSAR